MNAPLRHIVLRRTVPLAIPPDQARGAASAYLRGAGYSDCDGDAARFERGSRALTQVAFSPRLWHVQVTVHLHPAPDPREARVTFNVETTGQILSRGESGFWVQEADALAGSIRTGVPQAPPSSGSVLATNLTATVMMFGVTGLGLAGGIATAEILGGKSLVWIPGLAGGAVGLLLSQWIAARAFGLYAGPPPESDDSRNNGDA